MAQVLQIFLRPVRREPPQSVESAEAVADQGLNGDHGGKGKRQVTFLARESWEAACAEIGQELSPVIRRANVFVEGIDLAASIGTRLRVGGALVEILGETTPCKLMEESVVGLEAALTPDLRGGVYGRVLEGGRIACGDGVVQEPAQA